MNILTSWDDGTIEDLKVMNLLRKYKLPGIFFIPVDSWGFKNILRYKDFEIGSHTIIHPMDLKQLNQEELDREIKESRKILEKEINRNIDWFCYPRGRFDREVINTVRSAGYSFARTTRIGINGENYEKNGFHVFQRNEYGTLDWLDYIKNNLLANKDKKVDFHIWGHSKEIDRDENWEKLEELFKFIQDNFSNGGQ